MLNKDEAHIVVLPTKNREQLKQVILTEVLDNDNKLITPEMVRTALNALVDSVINWQDDNVDLRAYANENLVAVDNQTEFELQYTPINPEYDMLFAIDGVVQQYGEDYTVDNNVITFLPSADWQVKSTMKVTAQYRYFLVSSGGSGGGANPSTGINYIEVSLTNQSSVTITHNLGRLPIGITIYENQLGVFNQVFPQNVIGTNTSLQISFGVAFTGKILFI